MRTVRGQCVQGRALEHHADSAASHNGQDGPTTIQGCLPPWPRCVTLKAQGCLCPSLARLHPPYTHTHHTAGDSPQ